MEWLGLLVGIALLALMIRYLSAPEKNADSSSLEDQPRPWAETEPEPVELPIEDFIDLHLFAPQEIPEVVESYLEAALEKGFHEVRLIHGRGKGVQRARIRSLL
ncbi:MAG: Smr/MutS family protein, partial [Acidobacteriota bacterium]